MITSIGNNYYLYSKYNNLQDSVKVWYNNIDEKYIPLLGFKVKYGRNFIPGTMNRESGEVIVNEKLISQLNIENGNSQNAIGRFLTADGKKFEIVGVIGDFHWSTLDREIGPFMFRYSNTGFQFINAKILSTDIPATLGKIQELWKTIDNVHPLNVALYTDQIKRAYSNFYSMVRLIGFLAILEIIIASIGLLGMVVYSIELRLKEIGVRRVFGADFKNIAYILSKGYIFLMLLSALIALPIVLLIFIGLTNILLAQAPNTDKFLNSYVKDHNFSGTIRIQENDQIRYHNSSGFANRQFSIPNTSETKYKIASITKLFTSVLIMQLYEQGKVDLNSSVKTYLPGYSGNGADKITIRHLLNHTSGLPYVGPKSKEDALENGMEVLQMPHSIDELISNYYSSDLVSEPGKAFNYKTIDNSLRSCAFVPLRLCAFAPLRLYFVNV